MSPPLALAETPLGPTNSLLHSELLMTAPILSISTFLAPLRRREPQGKRDEALGWTARCRAADGTARVRIGPTAGSTAAGSGSPPGRCPPDQRVAPRGAERRLCRRPGQHPRGPGISGRESRGGTPFGGAGTIARRAVHQGAGRAVRSLACVPGARGGRGARPALC